MTTHHTIIVRKAPPHLVDVLKPRFTFPIVTFGDFELLVERLGSQDHVVLRQGATCVAYSAPVELPLSVHFAFNRDTWNVFSQVPFYMLHVGYTGVGDPGVLVGALLGNRIVPAWPDEAPLG